MRKYLIALAAIFAVVAALLIPHRGNSDAVKWAGSPPVPRQSLGGHRGTGSQKLQITPIQAQVSVVGLAFGH
jgi:hypothetical protein